MPAFLVGADVLGKPNFMTAAWSGIVNSNPPMLSVSLQHHRHTYKGVKEHGVFSINVPSAAMVGEADYCGIVSGAKEDKTAKCGFKVFYGKLPGAPLIEQCPLNLECRVLHILNLGSHALIVGEIVETHVSEDCLTEGLPDVKKIDPLVYTSGLAKAYYRLGPDPLAPAFNVGTEIKKRRP
jgi:flavin reductase (DIM6/NTAB) family NADH-FMN oxidoreductase RutF